MQIDKLIHAGCCFIIAAVFAIIAVCFGATLIGSAIIGFLAALAVGITKEYCDYINPNSFWDWWDLLADFIGALIGCCVSFFALLF